MSTITDIAGKVACGGSIDANLGKIGCLSLFGTPDHLLAVRRGTKIPANTTFDLAYLTPLIQAGTIIPLMGASAFEDLSAEDAYSTNTSGVKRLNLKGLPEYKFMYEEGHEFYRQLDKLEGYKSFDYIIGDDEGNWMMATNADGTFSGFLGGHTTPELTKRKVPGGDAESKSLLIQFLERSQFDRDYTILHQTDLTFSPLDVPLVNGVILDYTTVVVAGTSVEVTATLAQDHSTAVEGLTEFQVLVNGVLEAAASVAAGTNANDYVITTTSTLASTDTVVVYLGVAPLYVEESNTVLYRAVPNETETA